VFVLVVGLLAFIVNWLQSIRSGKPAGADPWGAPTLEWAIPSPPPPHNFGSLPEVHTLDPLWHKDHEQMRKDVNTIRGRIHMPPNSYWPFVAALGMTMLMAGMVLGWWVGIPGLLIMFVGIYSWAFEPC
jgi:heme/copper-type cytochrome/quinol oxidase subunit 1